MSFRFKLIDTFKLKYPLHISLLASGVLSYYFYNTLQLSFPSDLKDQIIQKPGKKLIFISDQLFYKDLVQYIYIHYKDNINEFTYDEDKIYTFTEWRHRRTETPVSSKVLFPVNCNFSVTYQQEKLGIDISMIMDKSTNSSLKLMESNGCCTQEKFVQKLTLESESGDLLVQFVDEAREYIKDENDKHRRATKETMCVYYYKKDYWILLSKSPKRPIDTIYLKKGEREKLVNDVEKFFSKETRDIYLSYGIPYKSVNMIYGPPGSGKTSTIKGIASVLDCDVYILPISKDMVDSDLVSAFTYINDKEDKERIIVIEDIDTLFDERKAGDKDSGITLQAFLNCMDGFTCVEGTMLFITANKPEVLDYALLRSCRIDNKIELGYADEYQTKEMYTTFLPNQGDKFKEFYNQIRHKEYTIAMLQEFLFYNRDCENIVDLMDQFTEIIDKNDPKNFEVIKDENKNFYS